MIRFMSKAAASFVMTEEVAQQVFKALGGDGHVPGIWVVERLPEVIAAAQAAKAAAKQQDAQTEAQLEAGLEALQSKGARPVGLSRRLVPVLEMLERARAAGEPVVWERN